MTAGQLLPIHPSTNPTATPRSARTDPSASGLLRLRLPGLHDPPRRHFVLRRLLLLGCRSLVRGTSVEPLLGGRKAAERLGQTAGLHYLVGIISRYVHLVGMKLLYYYVLSMKC